MISPYILNTLTQVATRFKFDRQQLHDALLVDSNINPSKGFKLDVDITYEKNNFIEGLDLSDAGTLVPNWANNDLWRIHQSSSLFFSIPTTNRMTISLESIAGTISNVEADSFFHFFVGGLNGLKGYPFYSIEGKAFAIATGTVRVPIFREKHIPIGWFIMQNSTVGFIGQTGDAWTRNIDEPNWLRSVGIQWRINGFSFYNFPYLFLV